MQEVKVPTQMQEVKVPTQMQEVKVPTQMQEVKVPKARKERKALKDKAPVTMAPTPASAPASVNPAAAPATGGAGSEGKQPEALQKEGAVMVKKKTRQKVSHVPSPADVHAVASRAAPSSTPISAAPAPAMATVMAVADGGAKAKKTAKTAKDGTGSELVPAGVAGVMVEDKAGDIATADIDIPRAESGALSYIAGAESQTQTHIPRAESLAATRRRQLAGKQAAEVALTVPDKQPRGNAKVEKSSVRIVGAAVGVVAGGADSSQGSSKVKASSQPVASAAANHIAQQVEGAARGGLPACAPILGVNVGIEVSDSGMPNVSGMLVCPMWRHCSCAQPMWRRMFAELSAYSDTSAVSAISCGLCICVYVYVCVCVCVCVCICVCV